MILFLTGLWEKIYFTIQLPRSKKYETKVDPIYELRESDWDDNVYIYKWSLMYRQNESWLMLLILIIIPYPIILEKFGYFVEDCLYICEKKNVIELGNDLKTIYENKMEKINQEEKIKKEKKDNIKNKFDTLNQIFNENYE
jgi:hypothetical protein